MAKGLHLKMMHILRPTKGGALILPPQSRSKQLLPLPPAWTPQLPGWLNRQAHSVGTARQLVMLSREIAQNQTK